MTCSAFLGSVAFLGLRGPDNSPAGNAQIAPTTSASSKRPVNSRPPSAKEAAARFVSLQERERRLCRVPFAIFHISWKRESRNRGVGHSIGISCQAVLLNVFLLLSVVNSG